MNANLNVVTAALGAEHFGVVEIHAGPPFLSLTPLSEAISPGPFASRRDRLGPYITNQPVAAPDPAVPAVGGHSIGEIGAAFAKALATKEDRQQTEQLKGGDVSNRGFLMAGDFDVGTGKIKSLALPTYTAAMLAAQRKTTVAERTSTLKRMLDTNNKLRPANSTRAIFRDMPDHDRMLATAIVKGLWSTVPRDTMDGKYNEASIFATMPYAKETIDYLAGEERQRKIREGSEGDSKQRDWIAVGARNLGYKQAQKTLANIMAIIESIVRCDLPGTIPIPYIIIGEWLDFLIDTRVEN